MFKPIEKSELNQISLTGVRAIVILGLLMVAPRSFEDLRKFLIEINLMEETNSIDTLRVDMNTLKAIGCEISRSNSKTNQKFILTKHPFSFEITKDEINVLRKIYKQIKKTKNIQELFDYDELFKKIAYFVQDEKIKEELLGISVFKRFARIDEIRDLIVDVENGTIIKLKYKKTLASRIATKEVVIKNIEVQNESIILSCFDILKNRKMTLNYARIVQILSRRKNDIDFEVASMQVRFKLTDFGVEVMRDNERIIDSDLEGYYIQGEYFSEFSAIQRVLSFGDKCTVIYPQDFRDTVISKLRNMRAGYDIE